MKTINFWVQGSPVQPATLLDVSGAVPESVVEKLLKACKTKSFDAIQLEVVDSIADGWPVSLPSLQKDHEHKILLTSGLNSVR